MLTGKNIELRWIMIAIIIEHVISYIIVMFRKRDIKRNGKPDINGVKRASTEWALSMMEIFIDSFLFGYIIKHQLTKSSEDGKYQIFIALWIILDSFIII